MRAANKYHLTTNIKYYFGLVKYNFLSYFLINSFVSLLDGIGIALFIPLLININSSNNTTSSSTLIQTLYKLLKSLGIEKNIIPLSAVILSIFIIKGAFRGLQVYSSAKIRFIIMNKIRIALLNNISKMSYFGFKQQKIGRLVNLFTGEMPKLYSNMTNLFHCIQNFIMAMTYIFFATMVNWRFAFIILVIVFFISLSFKKINKTTQDISKSITLKANSLNHNFIQLITNFKYLKATSKISGFSKKIKNDIINVEQENYKIGKLQSIGEALKEPLAITAIILLLVILEKKGSNNIDSFIISLILVYKAILNFNTLNSSLQSYHQTGGSVDSIKELNKELKAYEDHKSGTKKIKNINNIKLVNLQIMHSNTIILKNVNIEINKNEIVALIGESGSGKTSIINQILGLDSPDLGEVQINGVNSNSYTNGSINSKIGYISQESVIFNDSIFNNVTLFDEKTPANLKKFWEAVKLANIDGFIEVSELRENTLLGETGLLISGGQRQRIAIARELYKKPDLLIMDEATSALDVETEKQIMQNLNTLKWSCTIIIVAHRITALKNVDRFFLLENREIIAEGTYKYLSQTSKSFQRISAI